MSTLQWRAEQSLGQTPAARSADVDDLASMEGRAIARPNRPIGGDRGTVAGKASMEGRAIARPNQGAHRCPAALNSGLQWRAEQSLGQTAPTKVLAN